MRNLHLIIAIYTFFNFNLFAQDKVQVLLNPFVGQEESKTTLAVNINKSALSEINSNPNQILNLIIPLSHDLTISLKCRRKFLSYCYIRLS